jgi:uncharacterized membrane protein
MVQITAAKPAKAWLFYAVTTTVFWGIWGAFIELPEKAGFPATLGYVVWSFTMIPCALVALYIIKWKIEYDIRSISYGMAIGFLGAGGQLILFQALRSGPAYLVFPFISLFPIVTIFLSYLILREKAGRKQWTGIILALVAIFFLSQQTPAQQNAANISWFLFSIIVFVMWGLQAFVMKLANDSMKAESIFFYMMIASLVLVPFAIAMTDFSQPIFTGFKGPYLAGIIHLLNSVGALTLVYALRFGKAIVVVPLTGLSPVITVAISLMIYAIVPSLMVSIGVILAIIAIYYLSE